MVFGIFLGSGIESVPNMNIFSYTACSPMEHMEGSLWVFLITAMSVGHHLQPLTVILRDQTIFYNPNNLRNFSHVKLFLWTWLIS